MSEQFDQMVTASHAWYIAIVIGVIFGFFLGRIR